MSVPDGLLALIAGRGAILFAAILIDAVIGDPDWIYRRIAHPVVLAGRLITVLEARLNRGARAWVRRAAGMLTILLVLAIAAAAGAALHQLFLHLFGGWMAEVGAGVGAGAAEAVVASILLAQNSLYRHVRAVSDGLAQSLDQGRQAVARIVGRDPADLDRAGVGRAAVESLAENFSDGIVAPAFWFLVLGLPGLVAYKALNTADSMIGHPDPRYREFGWAAARLDDVANFIPARLAALLIAGGAALLWGERPGRPGAALRAARISAARHRSVNAGWPEAAMAGALGLALAGPRRYGGTLVADAWMGDGSPDLTEADIRRALQVFVRAACFLAMCVLAVTVLAAGMLAAG